jgi:hypothetical protein
VGVEAEVLTEAEAAAVAVFVVDVPVAVVLSAVADWDAPSAVPVRANVAANAAAPALREKRRALMYVKPTLSLSNAYGVS